MHNFGIGCLLGILICQQIDEGMKWMLPAPLHKNLLSAHTSGDYAFIY